MLEPCAEDTKINPLKQRRAGVLLHPTSLPSGKLDQDALRWLDWMAEAGLSVWQMLPLSIPDHTGSPYQSLSAFAVNPGLIGDQLYQQPALTLSKYHEMQAWWLEDYLLFQVLKQKFQNQPWWQWPDEFRLRDSQALASLKTDYAELYASLLAEQYQLDMNWLVIRDQAKSRNIVLFGDMPIFIALDSADVWANPEEFLLDENFEPEYVAGVPPDYFSETGQRWGNPHYDWETMQANDFAWWKKRIQRQFDWFDIVRLDHFRGLEAVWMIKASCDTAIEGFWQKTPGDQLLATLKTHYPELPIVAEDLGIITDEVRALIDKYQLPGMSVLQFAFDHYDDNPHKPKNLHPDRVVYTGTHDNNTTQGWFNELSDDDKRLVFSILEQDFNPDMPQVLLETALHSLANLSVAPLQDLLKLGEEARMNVPGQVENNWNWRFDWEQIPAELAGNLKQLITDSGRA